MDSSEAMRLTVLEASKVASKVYPYPGVAAAILKDGAMIALATNGVPGEPHAEHTAIKMTSDHGVQNPESWVLYTNLEPCAANTKMDSCAQRIIDFGIKEVHVAHLDPYHLVRGAGVQMLRDAGVRVVVGELEEEARHVNKQYMERFCPHCGWVLKD